MLAGLMLLATAAPAAAAPGTSKPDSIAIPDGQRGIGYDDLQVAPDLKRILVPAGRTGRLVLIDPATRALTAIAGFSTSASFGGGHGEGTTSAVEVPGGRWIVATDRGSRMLKLVSTQKNAI